MDTRLILTGVVLILLVYLFNKYFIQVYDYWKKRGVPTLPGALPFLGHTHKLLLSAHGAGAIANETYDSFKGRSMVGYYQLRKPGLVLRDPELVKSVLISNFPNFNQNIITIDRKVDPLLAENPFFNYGDQWKIQRNRLSYALMSGKRLRDMCVPIAKVCEKFTNYLKEEVAKSKNQVFEFDAKVLCNEFTGEVVANAGFGVEGDFFRHGTGPNSFREAVRAFMEPSLKNLIEQTLIFFFPKLNSIMRVSLLPKRMDRFFRRIIHDMIILREKKPSALNDFLQLLLDSRDRKEGKLTEENITASATSFFVDGYETSAITLGFLIYQMAANRDCQEKLRDEVNRVLEEHNGEITYESLSEMTYMDRCLNESMRLTPALSFLSRKCNGTTKFVGNDGVECLVEPGTEILIPVQSLSKDPEYWNEPEVYDPERFNDRSSERPKTVFLPFGEGPRICVGMRFATLQIKGAMATILKNFKVQVSNRTKQPLQLNRTALLATVEGGLWIDMKPL